MEDKSRTTNLASSTDVVRILENEMIKGVGYNGERVSEIPKVKMNHSTEEYRFMHDFGCGDDGTILTNGVLREDENVGRLANTSLSKGGADDVLEELPLLSSEKTLSKLSPVSSLIPFRAVDLSDSDLTRIVGKRVKVYCSDSGEWFSGAVKSFGSDTKLHRILYDDGEEENLDLKRERFELEVPSSESQSLFALLTSNHEKYKSSDVGEVSKEMKNGSINNMRDIKPLKTYSRMKRRSSEAAGILRLVGHQENATDDRAEGFSRVMEVDMQNGNREDKLTTDGNCRDDLGGDNKEQCASGFLNGNKSTSTGSCSPGDIDCRKPEKLVRDGVLPAEANTEKQPRKRNRGADGEITKALLLTPENNLSTSKLRPRKLVPSFQKVELTEKDFERIVGKRVKVYWPYTREWCVGRIKSFDIEKKLHRILYDGGDKEEVDLTEEQFELEVMSNEAFNICSDLGVNHEKKEISSDDDEVKKDANKNGTLDLALVEGVKNGTRINERHVSKALRKEGFQFHGGRASEEKSGDMIRDMDLDIQPDSENQVKFIEDTYWYMYDEINKEQWNNESLDLAHLGVMQTATTIERQVSNDVEKRRIQLQGGNDAEESTEEMVSYEVYAQPDVADQVKCSKNTYWYMYLAEDELL